MNGSRVMGWDIQGLGGVWLREAKDFMPSLWID